MTADTGALNGGGGMWGSREIKLHHVLLVGIILVAAFTRFWRLGEPDRCYFDEVYFPTTAAEILRGDPGAWEFYGHENTHPPLSKVLMAVGMGIFGHSDPGAGANDCWGDQEDESKRTNPAWLYDSFGWRFPGALAGVGAVVFMYLLARHIFRSEAGGLAAGFLLAVDGLALTQARIATPDTYVLCFMLGCLYFLVTKRLLISGLFLGAAAASKWIGAFAVAPILLYLAWMTFVRLREAGPDPRMRQAERVFAAGLAAIVFGALVAGGLFLVGDGLSSTVLFGGGVFVALGAFIILGGLVAVWSDGELRSSPRARVYIQTAVSIPLFFIAVPFAVYMAAYIPMFAAGHGLDHWWDLNRSAYEFHSSLEASHPYEAPFLTWPINMRPVFFFLGQGHAKIYNLGNPIVFWMALPALAFTMWQGLRFVRARLETGGSVAVWGRIGEKQFAPLWVVGGYLALWLALSTQGRALFLYHYLPALAFAILALGFTVHWLWDTPVRFGRPAAIASLAVAGAVFVYFYPHWTGIDVPGWLDDSYYWFDTWR
jgi:dolichyl-phosphate-mannose--protein O-mannosyl transferase